MTASFTVRKHLSDDGVVRLAVGGEVDLSTGQALRHLIVNAALQRPTRLIVDLGQVTFMDSTGVDALVTGRAVALEHGAAYRVTNPCSVVRRALEVTDTLAMLTGDGPAALQLQRGTR
ncbi:STAS domain-containing protein [Planomonospora corallina]|uniref:STAS domain-containing protein n=1 Tax=Planomonospora corallina TaxID=1806052 RepID=A0ABV8IHB8_9ACTN